MAFENHDVMVDSPLNNFATINPLGGQHQSYYDIFDGNLKFTNSTTANTVDFSNYLVSSIFFGMDTSFYFEVNMPDKGDSSGNFYGIFQKETINTSLQYGRIQATTGSHNAVYQWASYGTIVRINSSGETTYAISSPTTSTVIGMFYNATDRTFSYYYDGILQQSVDISMFNDAYALRPVFFSYYGEVRINFGQDQSFGGAKSGGGGYLDANGIGQFYHQPPAGALALCTKNLPSGPIDVHQDDIPADYFKAVTWRGDNVNGRQIDTDGVGTGTGFQPDLVWVAIRSGQAGVQTITDSLRQVGSMISPNGDYNMNVFDASWKGSYGQITELNSTGFKVNKGSSSSNFNSDNNEYVAWTWRAAGPSNSGEVRIIELDGSLSTSTASDFAQAMNANAYPNKISANRKSGFSMVQYSGIYENARVPHGLSQTPEMIIVKSYSSTENWMVKHKDLSSGHYLMLNHTNQQAQNSTIFETQEDNAQYFWLGGNNAVNTGSNYMAYCWHSVPGYSKIGSYVGVTSGNPYIHLGFRAAFIMIKAIDGSIHSNYQSWSIFDTARNSHNPSNTALYANAAWAEGMDGAGGSGGVGGIDIVSNGFRLLDGAASYSGIDGVRHLYMAFAENPFNAPATAR